MMDAATRDDIAVISETQRQQYDGLAARYDEHRFRTQPGSFYEELANRQIFDLLGRAREGEVLDVGTGTGRVAIGLGKRGIRVTGVDVSEHMLAQAAAKAAKSGVRCVAFRRANAAELPFDDATFDAVVSFRFLHIMVARYQGAFVDEMVRVLKPGGTLVVELNNALPHLFQNLSGGDPNVVIWPWNIRGHFGDRRPVEIVDMVGIGLPGLGRISRYSQRISAAIGLTLQRGPGAFLGRQVAVKAVKTDGRTATAG